jgi:NAD(P)-dependent dehydrogenase (short-subunit alcohol dehydrogenase family)
MSDALRLFGTRAIVTGAVDGIGEAIVRTFIKQGALVFAVDRSDSGVDTQFSALRGVTPHVGNPSDREGADELIAAAADALGGLDVVVNNGAVQTKTPIADGDAPELDAFLERKLRIYTSMSRAALPHLEKSPAGRIVNIGCLRSAFAKDGIASYQQSRQSLSEFTVTLASEVGPDGITVNYIQPGAIMTPASRRVFNENKDLRDYCIGYSAAQRLGEPVDVAKVALFLASDDAVFVSGTGIVVDGGATGAR